MKRFWKLLLPIAIIICGALACGNSTDAGTIATPLPSSVAPQTYKIGQLVALSGWDITVNSAKKSTGDDISKPKEGDIYLEISVTLQNTTTTTQSVSSLISFKLADSTGQSYSETIVTSAPNPPDGSVSPNQKTKGTLSYEVPKSEKTFTLSFSPDLTATTQSNWELTVP